jgi:SAM-dependent methyltransferase
MGQNPAPWIRRACNVREQGDTAQIRMGFEREKHWENVYASRAPDETSWHQRNPSLSLAMIERCGPAPASAMIDIGGGASLLVDHLLDRGFEDLTVLDISARALDRARKRLGERAAAVQWIKADITQFGPNREYDVWHDRAAFHFLTAADDREAYAAVLRRALSPGGRAIIATFAPDGPERCSGLEIVRYDAESIQAALGTDFQLVEEQREIHRTPAGGEQSFMYFGLERA